MLGISNFAFEQVSWENGQTSTLTCDSKTSETTFSHYTKQFRFDSKCNRKFFDPVPINC